MIRLTLWGKLSTRRITCEQAEKFLRRYDRNEIPLSQKDDDAWMLHLGRCPACCKAYNEYFHRDWVQAQADLDDESEEEKAYWDDPVRVYKSMATTWAKIAARESDLRVKQSAAIKRFALISGGVVGCILLTLGGWAIFGGRSAPEAPTPMAANSAHPAGEELSIRLPLADLLPLADNLDALNYAAWRETHRDTFPVAMLKAQGDASAGDDPIEAMILSGAIWQFHYSSELGPMQPLMGTSAASAVTTASTAEALADSAQSLGSWQAALHATGPDQAARQADLMLLSIRAGQHLAATRTTAYLWAKEHPARLMRLQASLALHLSPDSAASTEALLRTLRSDAIAARQCARLAMEWSLQPTDPTCGIPAAQKRLADLIGTIQFPASQPAKQAIAVPP